jgi:hypothetical protein
MSLVTRLAAAFILCAAAAALALGQDATPSPSPSPAVDKETAQKLEREQKARDKEAAKRLEEEKKQAAKEEAERQKAVEKRAKQQAKEEKTQREREASIPVSVNATYDRFKDVTTVSSAEMPVFNQLLNRALTGTNYSMTVLVQYNGTLPRPPYAVVFVFNIRTVGYQPVFYSGPDVIFLGNANRFISERTTAAHETYVNWYPFLGNVTMTRTYVGASLGFSQFEELSTANTAEFRLGDNIEAPLQQRHLEAFRALVSEVKRNER